MGICNLGGAQRVLTTVNGPRTPISHRTRGSPGLVAAGGNVLGGYFVVRKEWPRKYLQYFLALGAGYMLSVAFVEVIPESVHLAGENALLFVLIGYFLIHLFEHTIAPHFHFGEETHTEEMHGHHARRTVLLGMAIHTFFDGVAIAAGFLVSTWLGMVIFVAVFLHKLPEGFTMASVVLASGQGNATRSELPAFWAQPRWRECFSPANCRASSNMPCRFPVA